MKTGKYLEVKDAEIQTSKIHVVFQRLYTTADELPDYYTPFFWNAEPWYKIQISRISEGFGLMMNEEETIRVVEDQYTINDKFNLECDTDLAHEIWRAASAFDNYDAVIDCIETFRKNHGLEWSK